MIKTIWLSWEEQQKLAVYAKELTAYDELSLYQHMPAMGDAMMTLLNPDTCAQLADFTQSETNILRVSGLLFDVSLPETPYEGYLDSANIPVASVMQLAMFSAMGIQPIAYNRENRGLLFRHVVPTKKRVNKVSSHGSDFSLDMHISNPILPIIPEATNGVSGSPEILSFFGLRQDSGES